MGRGGGCVIFLDIHSSISLYLKQMIVYICIYVENNEQQYHSFTKVIKHIYGVHLCGKYENR